MKIVSKTINRLRLFFSIRQNTWLKNKFDAWLTVRIPEAKQHVLSNRNIFIMPTKFGLSFLAVITLLFLLATNYQNNIIMLLSYLLASIFITCMLTSFFNLAGLKVNMVKQSQGFASQNILYSVELQSTLSRYHLHFNFKHQDTATMPHCSSGICHIQVPFKSEQRGRYLTGRLKISSEYCFGLFITWTQLEFAAKAIVFPKAKPIKQSLLSNDAFQSIDSYDAINQRFVAGTDDFYQLKPYQQGEPLSQIAWKQVAQGKGYFSKEYQKEQQGACWLNLKNMPNNQLESKLQILAFLIKKYSEQGQVFGLDLNVITISPNSNIKHTNECLIALADYPKASR